MKCTTSFLKDNIVPVQEGIYALTEKYRKSLHEELQRDIKLFPKSVIIDDVKYLIGYDMFGTTVVLSVACGKHLTVWDASNWKTIEPTPEQIEAIKAANIDGKTKEFKQNLISNNIVLQSIDKEQIKLGARILKAKRKFDKSDANAEFYDAISDYFDGTDDYEQYELMSDHSLLSIEYVQGVEAMAQDYIDMATE